MTNTHTFTNAIKMHSHTVCPTENHFYRGKKKIKTGSEGDEAQCFIFFLRLFKKYIFFHQSEFWENVWLVGQFSPENIPKQRSAQL